MITLTAEMRAAASTLSGVLRKLQRGWTWWARPTGNTLLRSPRGTLYRHRLENRRWLFTPTTTPADRFPDA